ncbi:MAG: MBG domain-containing protein, partial [Bacteroidales bacterium]|nr:MBG domain-containing protein [Bacteroidales bacterium]
SPNFDISYGLGQINILKAQAEINLSETTQVFDGNDKKIVYNTIPEGLRCGVSYDGNEVPPVNTGTYEVKSWIIDPNYTGSVTGILTVLPAEITVTADDKSKTYGDPDPEFTFTVTSGSLVNGDQINGMMNRDPGEDAGQYMISKGTLGAGENYTIQFTPGTLQIDQAELSVTSGTYWIYEGDALPDISFTFDSFVNGDNESAIFGTNRPYYLLTPEYAGLEGVYTVALPAIQNYSIAWPEEVKLYVNPNGPGTKAIMPSLLCIEDLVDDPDGFTYLAHFKYENKNEEVVYVPVGENNRLIAEGEYFVEKIPEVFFPGEGFFDVLFDGEKLIWEVSSRDEGHPSSVASEASWNSSRCSSQLKSLGVTGGLEEEEHEFGVYPNPADERLFVQLGGLEVSGEVTIIDFKGKIHAVPQRKTGDDAFEIDICSFASGFYILRLRSGKNYHHVHFIKR